MPDILVEFIGGRIALGRRFLQRLDDDGIKVAPEKSWQLLCRRGARLRHRFCERDTTRGYWLGLEDCLFQRSPRSALELVWTLSRHQLIEHDAERVYIGHSRHRRARQLFGRGVVRGQRTTAELRQLRLFRYTVRQKLRNSKIQQLGLTIVSDEDVRGFQIAVNNEMSVRILDCTQNLTKKLKALAQREAAVVAVLG